MSFPATTGSAASAATGVNPSPISARTSSSAARSLATPITFAPAPASAMATPRPKPRLAPVTSAVDPDNSCADIRNSLILGLSGFLPASVLIRATAGTHRPRWAGAGRPVRSRPAAMTSAVPADLYRYAGRRRRGDAEQRRLRTADRAVPPGVAGALLPDARLDLRRRGPGAGNPGPGLAVLQRFPGPVVAADLAVPDRDQCLPAGHREPRPAAAALGPERSRRGSGRAAGPGAAGGAVAAAAP